MQGSRLKLWLVAALGLGNALVVSAQDLPLAVAVRPYSEQHDGPGLRAAEQAAAGGAFAWPRSPRPARIPLPSAGAPLAAEGEARSS